MRIIVLNAILVLSVLKSLAQSVEKKDFLYSHRISVVFGLIQPMVLKGGNVEVNYTTKRMIFDYSHGFSLDPPSAGAYKDENVVLHLPYSTGFGIGYRLNSFLDIRIEPKLHSWEVYYKDEVQSKSNKLKDYKTFTLGAGLYYRYFPFRNSKLKGLQGITTAASLRYWPKIGTTLSKDSFIYDNKFSGKTITQKAANIGMANTPFIINVSVGYTFGGK